MRDRHKPNQRSTDILSEQEGAEFVQLVNDLDTIYTVPKPPANLTWAILKARHTEKTFDRRQRSSRYAGHFLFKKPVFSGKVLLPLLFVVILGASAFAVVSPLLAGVLGLEPSTNGLIDANLFADIHQSQTVGGTTITLEKAYADTNQVIIGYTISPVNVSLKSLFLDTREGIVLSQGGDMAVGSSASENNIAAASWVFDTSAIPGSPKKLDLQLKIVVGQSNNTPSPGKTLGTAVFNFSLPFHSGRLATPHERVTVGGRTATLERVTVNSSSTRLIVQGLDRMDQVKGGFVGTLQVPGAFWKTYDYGTASPKADGSWSFVYPFDFTDKHGTWTLTVEENNHTWVFHFDVP